MSRRMLVAGVGNVFLGDDAFGVEVAQRLAAAPQPAGVEVVDVGIRGIHLAYQLLDGYEELVLVDAVARGDAPGTVTVLQPVVERVSADPLDPHRLEPGPLLASVAALGALPERVLVVGCEPADVGDGMGFSPPVQAALAPALDVLRRLVDDFVERGRNRHEEEAPAARGARSDRVRPLPPAPGHRALPQDPADVKVRSSPERGH